MLRNSSQREVSSVGEPRAQSKQMESSQDHQNHEEWVPGLSQGRRILRSHEVVAHLDFGKQIHKEGNDFFSNAEYESAYDRYNHGVQLLCWVQGSSFEETYDIEKLLLIFYRNLAQAALNINRWTEALNACEQALKLTSNLDCKALFRKAEALQLLGRLSEAEGALLYVNQILLSQMENALSQEQSTPITPQSEAEASGEEKKGEEKKGEEKKGEERRGEEKRGEKGEIKEEEVEEAKIIDVTEEKKEEEEKEGDDVCESTRATTPRDLPERNLCDEYLKLTSSQCEEILLIVNKKLMELRNRKIKEDKKMQTIVKKSIEKSIFSDQPKETPLTEEKKKQLEKVQKQREEYILNKKLLQQYEKEEKEAAATTSTPNPSQSRQKLTFVSERQKDFIPLINLQEAHEALDDLLEFYATPGFQFLMDQIRLETDYCERKIIIKARNRIPEVVYPYIKKYGFSDPDYAANKKLFDENIQYWRMRDATLSEKSRDLFKLVLGDAALLD